MSAILEPRSRIALRERTLPDFDTALAPPQSRPQKRTKPRQRVSRLALALRVAVKLALYSTLATVVATAACQFLFESARREANGASSRATRARSELSGLRRQIDSLQSAERIETWAALNGFVPSYLAADERPE
jgi:cell division protein FtsL